MAAVGPTTNALCSRESRDDRRRVQLSMAASVPSQSSNPQRPAPEAPQRRVRMTALPSRFLTALAAAPAIGATALPKITVTETRPAAVDELDRRSRRRLPAMW